MGMAKSSIAFMPRLGSTPTPARTAAMSSKCKSLNSMHSICAQDGKTHCQWEEMSDEAYPHKQDKIAAVKIKRAVQHFGGAHGTQCGIHSWAPMLWAWQHRLRPPLPYP